MHILPFATPGTEALNSVSKYMGVTLFTFQRNMLWLLWRWPMDFWFIFFPVVSFLLGDRSLFVAKHVFVVFVRFSNFKWRLCGFGESREISNHSKFEWGNSGENEIRRVMTNSTQRVCEWMINNLNQLNSSASKRTRSYVFESVESRWLNGPESGVGQFCLWNRMWDAKQCHLSEMGVVPETESHLATNDEMANGPNWKLSEKSTRPAQPSVQHQKRDAFPFCTISEWHSDDASHSTVCRFMSLPAHACQHSDYSAIKSICEIMIRSLFIFIIFFFLKTFLYSMACVFRTRTSAQCLCLRNAIERWPSASVWAAAQFEMWYSVDDGLENCYIFLFYFSECEIIWTDWWIAFVCPAINFQEISSYFSSAPIVTDSLLFSFTLSLALGNHKEIPKTESKVKKPAKITHRWSHRNDQNRSNVAARQLSSIAKPSTHNVTMLKSPIRNLWHAPRHAFGHKANSVIVVWWILLFFSFSSRNRVWPRLLLLINCDDNGENRKWRRGKW